MHEDADPAYASDEEVADGFTIVDESRALTDAGMPTHRGILQSGEYVDYFALRSQVEAELGFTYADISAAYAVGGRLTPEARQRREKIDARLLALSHAGGSLVSLAEAVGINEKTVDRALARAKAVHVEPQVKNPAVRSTLVCFKCGKPGATPRRRRFSESPAGEVGTINLCDEHHYPYSSVGGRRSSKRHVNVVGLIRDHDNRTFGGRRIGVDWA